MSSVSAMRTKLKLNKQFEELAADRREEAQVCDHHGGEQKEEVVEMAVV